MVTRLPSSPTSSAVDEDRSSRMPPSKQYLDGSPSIRSRRSSSVSSSRTLVPSAQSSKLYPSSPSTGSSHAPSSYSAVREDRTESRRRAPSVSSHASAGTAANSRERSYSHRRRVMSGSGSSVTGPDPPSIPTSRNSFPWFGESGDVEISIQQRHVERRYLLHRVILAQNSPWWEQEFRRIPPSAHDVHTQSPSKDPRYTARNSGPARLKYKLDHATAHDTGTLPMLVRYSEPDSDSRSFRDGPPPPVSRNKPSLHHGRPPSSRTEPLSDDEQDLLGAYDNLFAVYYNHQPVLDTTNIANAYVQSKVLLQLGLLYKCNHLLGSRIEHHMLNYQSRLWRQIAKYPPSYLRLGYLARSKVILSEALIHVVGQWPSGSSQLSRDVIPDKLRDLIEDKVDELDESRMRAECKLFRLNLTTSRGERVSPSNSWTDWLAVSVFRQWIAEASTPALTSILKDSSQSSRKHQTSLGRMYRSLYDAGEAYLTQHELKQFLKSSPDHYSRDTLRRVVRKVDELKTLASQIAKPLARSSLQLGRDVRHGHAGDENADFAYLTCTKVRDTDFEHLWGSS